MREKWEVLFSVVLHPTILLDKGIDHFLHSQVRDQLILGQGAPGDRVEVTDSLQRRFHESISTLHAKCMQGQ